MGAPGTTTTYVLLGQSSYEEDTLYSQREKAGENVKVLRYNKYHGDIENALKEIKPPANIVIACHGADGCFFYGPGAVTYKEFFKELSKQVPNGVESVVTLACQGGSFDERDLKYATAGTIVLSDVSAKNLALSTVDMSFIAETRNTTNPIDLYIKVLDNYDPQNYYNAMKGYHILFGFTSSNPEQALPYIIGIGGAAPIQVNLKTELEKVQLGSPSACNNTPFTEAAWDNALIRVGKNFDTKHFFAENSKKAHENDNHLSLEMEQAGGRGENAEKALQQEIKDIAAKIRSGVPIGKSGDHVKDAEELRIAYALTAAYLDESGQITALQQKQRDAAAPHKLAQLTGDIPKPRFVVSDHSLEAAVSAAPLETPGKKPPALPGRATTPSMG